MNVVVRVPATCGELLQGVDADGPLLVSLPIAAGGTVRVTLTRDGARSVTPHRPKARAALDLALDRVGWRGGAEVELGGEVSPGRGMGSSTIDVAGVIAGVAAAAGVALPDADLVALMTAVEPSDSSPLPGLWLVDHLHGSRAIALGAAPQWRLVVADSGASVDTVALHCVHGPGEPLPATLVRRTTAATRAGDAVALARVATESAALNQARLPHPAFDAVRRMAERLGALGVCVAHSGSLCAAICASDASAAAVAGGLHAEGLASTTTRVVAPGLRIRRLRTDDRDRRGGECGVLGDRRAAIPALLVQRADAHRLPVRARLAGHRQ